MVLISEASKQIIHVTVPLEDCIKQANDRKRAKHTDLVTKCPSNK